MQLNVSVRAIDVAFGNVRVLENFDIEVQQSELLVLLGPSGCGKSTLLNAVAGLVEVDAGQIWIGSRNVTWDEPKDRGIAMVFQSYALYPRMSVRGNLSFGLRVARMPAAEIERRVLAVAEMLKIGDLLDRRPAQLSGGQRQRVAIGRALVREVGVYLFDEPLSNLDAQLRAELRVEIKRLHQRLGATMIYVTHDQIEALTLADRIAVMKDRAIQQLGDPQSIYLKPANRFVAGFVGSPSMNFVGGRLIDASSGPAFECENLRVPLSGYAFATRLNAGRPVELGIRPEHVVVGSTGPVVCETVVEMVEPMGSNTLAWTRLGDSPFSIRLDGETGVKQGDRLPLCLPPARLNLFDPETGIRL
jgi:multiple sugar transport system ATP-binding protein